MKGKLILREVKFLRDLRSEAGWAITWVLGPGPQATWGRGKQCGGASRRDAEEVRRWPGRGCVKQRVGQCGGCGVCEACSGCLPRTSLSSSVSGPIHCFLPPQRNPLYSSPGRTPGSLGMLSDSCECSPWLPHRVPAGRALGAAAWDVSGELLQPPFRQQEAQPQTLGQEAPALAG